MDPNSDKTTEEYGNPHEGFRAALPGISPDERTRLQRQYLSRRSLAQWSHLAEGQDILLRFSDKTTATFRLLTPPNMTAVRNVDEDGRVTWSRRIRKPDTDPPIPYDWTWYTQYLQGNNLPIWFLQPQHLDILEEGAEGAILRLNCSIALGSRALSRVSEVHPDVWYPDPRINQGRPYILDLTGDDARYVAGNFPAALTQAEEQMEGYCTVMLPTGHVVVRPRMSVPQESNVSGLVTDWLSHDEIVSVTGGQTQSTLASFANGGDDVIPPADVLAQRADAYEIEVGNNSYINPGQLLSGLGVWDFLTDDDRLHAASLGFRTPQQVTEARAHGLIPLGAGPDRRPVVIFRPEIRYLNPTVQPDGLGTWRYLSPSVEQLAHLNYGGDHELGLYDTPLPTASDIWTLRNIFTRNRRLGFAEDIDIIWDPFTTNDEAASQSQRTPPIPILPPRQDPLPAADHTEQTGANEGNKKGKIVPGPHGPKPGRLVVGNDRKLLVISPGAHNWQSVDWNPRGNQRASVGMDQRSKNPELVHYDQIRGPDGRLVFADRGVVRPKEREPHKRWAWDNTRGQWKAYKPAENPGWDWNNVESINGLNKWRDQSFTRWGWPHKRTERRDDYSEAENRWLWHRLRLRPDGSVDQDIKTSNLAAAFKRRFGYERSEAALNSKLSRAKKNFRNDQTYKPPEGRGTYKQRQSNLQQPNDKEGEDEREYGNEGEGEDEGEYGEDPEIKEEEEEQEAAEEEDLYE